MGVKERVVAHLVNGEYDTLAGTAAQEPRVLRALIARLWDLQPHLQRGAALTLGKLAARSPEKGIELTRRFLWALNEESGANGAAVVPALAAMAAAAPGVVGPFAGPLTALLEDETLRGEVRQALRALHAAAPIWLEPHASDLRRWGVLPGDDPQTGGDGGSA